MIIGIDLGTTYSVAAYMADDGPKLIPNSIGEFLTPSVVGIDQGGELLVGRVAKEFQVSYPERCASIFKRYMGTNWTTTLDRRTFTAEELSSLVLRSIKQDAEAFLKRTIDRAVITVPAYFNDDQRKATILAGQLAGLKVERIINEPTAAAIAYGLHEEGDEKIVVVFDLGGGTFDVSVVDMFEGAVEVRASSGECFLGGEDFTRTLAARLLDSQGEPFERAEMSYPQQVSRLVQLCERAKCELTKNASANVRIPDKKGNLSDTSVQVEVTREQFEKWTERLLASVEMPIRRGLGDAKLKRSDVDEVILVGGATRMPAVVKRVTEIFGTLPHSRLNPDQVVALGAAVQAGMIGKHQALDDLVVTDVAPFTLGVEISKRFGTEIRDGYFMPVINRNTTIPVSKVDRVATLHAQQKEVRVKVYQGESRRVEENLLLGEFTVSDIPIGPLGQEIELRFTYDLNGVLEVEATVVATKKKTGIVITRNAKKGMNAQDIAQSVARMASLKSHPRDESQNQLLLKRVERIYRELALTERNFLNELTDGFEAALADNDASAIEISRQALEQFLSSVEPDPTDSDHDEMGGPDRGKLDW